MPAPCDPSPYATIAARLSEARNNRPATAPDSVRTKAALRSFLARNAPSSEAARARDARMQASADDHQAFKHKAGI